MDVKLKELAVELFNAGVFKFGKFYTTGGCVIDAWFDLLVVFAYPSLMDKIIDYAKEFYIKENLSCHSVCGVSYAGLPFGVLLASKLKKPLVMWRKEPSNHATDQRITGEIFKNTFCLVFEEVTCSGRSTLGVIKDIENAGMRVKDIYVVIDLEQGAVENLEKMGYNVHSMLKMSQFVKILFEEKCVTIDRYNNIIKGYSEKFASNGDCITNTNLGLRKMMKYEKRVDECKSKIGQELLKLMSEKKSNLCVEFVNQNMDVVLQAAELVGPHVCVLAIHWNIFENAFEESRVQELVQISKKHNFFLMDDSKLSDDDESVLIKQCRYRLKYVDLLTIYGISGKNALLSVKSIIENEFPGKGVFVVACPNIGNAVIGSNYEKNSITMTINCFEEVTGFISHKNSEIPPSYIHMTSDLKISGADGKSVKNDIFYSSEVMVSDIAADIIQLHYDSLENIGELVKKEQLSLWDTYVKRIGMY